MYTITVSEKGGQQSTFEFNKPEVTIGRMKGNDIVLPKGNVSKRHSRIYRQNGAFSIVDLESTNGTYVNGRKIAGEQAIAESDKIYIGDFILQLELAQSTSRPGAPPAPPQKPGLMDLGGGAGGAERNMSPTDYEPARDRPSGGHPSAAAGAPPQPPAGRAPAPGGGSPGIGAGGGAGMSGGMAPAPSIDFDDIDFEPALNMPAKEPRAAASAPAPASPAARSGAPRPSNIGAPKLQGDFRPGPHEDPTVDRLGDRMMPRGGQSKASAVLTSDELESEFDADFHAAQHDVARVLFEQIGAHDLPMAYPPSPEDRERFHQAVQSAVSTVNPRVDREELVNLMTSECVGLGPLEFYLDDGDIRDIYVNRFDQVLVRRGGKLVAAARAFSHPQMLMAAAYRLLGPREVETFTEELRFNDGTRVHVILPPLSVDGPAITVRKPPSVYPSLDDLVSQGVLTAGMAEFLLRATEAGRSILVAGPTSSGKSTLLSALTRQMASGVRVIGVEDNAHLRLPTNAVRLEANSASGYDMRYLLRTALSMHPQRIILDECRGAEAYDWVTSAACGTEGSMMALHGTSAADALGRLESLCLLGSADVSPRGLREQIARAVDLVVVVNRCQGQDFRVQQITEVQGVDLDAFRLNDIFYYRVEGTDGAFHPTGYIPLFFEDLRNAGADVDFGIFRE